MRSGRLSLAVVGADYPNKTGPSRRFEIALCGPGEPVELRLEPENPADPRAVAVYSDRGVQLGYLTADRAPWIGAMLSRGRVITAIFQEQARYGAVVRVAFDGEAPELPERATVAEESAGVDADQDPGWWPDDDWID
ncbi:HIRAN domain-containing protein [Novosphingobium sp. BW1]|uniref:HIRAN domain-containing protein n=1 Tax=Novosphingobium sp. BW1 TaxID=2592621 RepID=UPI0011DE60C7|nr:HIRAN domain-containing protein [Novosphingobium sp. BW1]TYC93022.1 hypothetical protein FMM79_03280 [Novosphingobium sp. BW1]